MGGLLQFLIRIRFFLLFISLEGVCVYLLVSQNFYQRVVTLNSSNEIVAKTMAVSDAISDYFYLGTINGELAAENAALRKELMDMKLAEEFAMYDTLPHPLDSKTDSVIDERTKIYDYRVAKVVNNSVNRLNNFLTINKGTTDGIAPGMAVISPEGVVGKIRFCSPNFSTVTSALHQKMIITSSIQRIGASGAVTWPGNNPRIAKMQNIARHLKPRVGDSVVTGEQSSVFPPGVMIGRISKVDIKDNETFFDIDVTLATDFSTLQYVYVVYNKMKQQQDSLQAITDPKMNE